MVSPPETKNYGDYTSGKVTCQVKGGTKSSELYCQLRTEKGTIKLFALY